MSLRFDTTLWTRRDSGKCIEEETCDKERCNTATNRSKGSNAVALEPASPHHGKPGTLLRSERRVPAQGGGQVLPGGRLHVPLLAGAGPGQEHRRSQRLGNISNVWRSSILGPFNVDELI